MSKKYDIAVVVGRFQIPHIGHEAVFKEASQIAKRLCILVGSVGQPQTIKNPFTFEQRKEMIEYILPSNCAAQILPIRDQRYNTQNWVVDVTNKVNTIIRGWQDKVNIVLVGHHKDDSSYYLDLFPQWDYHEIKNVSSLSSTVIREDLFKAGNQKTRPYNSLNVNVNNKLTEWQMSENFQHLVEEYKFIEKYKNAWKSAPYSPTFNTVDAIVVQAGHILLIKRNAAPGKGLWALPGGFVNQNETLKSAVIRELIEETQIKLPAKILERNIRKEKTFDDPNRSLRGRTITQVYLIVLDGRNLPRVKGADDAEKAKWIPLNEVYMMSEKMYEDHFDIILNMTGDL